MSRCMCGATDCPRCFPFNWDNGVYLEATCARCAGDFWRENCHDESTLCPECRAESEAMSISSAEHDTRH